MHNIKTTSSGMTACQSHFHAAKIQPPHWGLIKHANIFFCTFPLLLKISLTNENLRNNSLINYYLCSWEILNSVWWDEISAAHLGALDGTVCFQVPQLEVEFQNVPQKEDLSSTPDFVSWRLSSLWSPDGASEVWWENPVKNLRDSR